MSKNVRMAKETLFNLIEKGVEYPTAHERVCLRFNLSDSEAIDLTEQYDSHCMKPYKN